MEASTEIAVTCEVDAPSAMAFWKRMRSSCHLAAWPGRRNNRNDAQLLPEFSNGAQNSGFADFAAQRVLELGDGGIACFKQLVGLNGQLRNLARTGQLRAAAPVAVAPQRIHVGQNPGGHHKVGLLAGLAQQIQPDCHAIRLQTHQQLFGSAICFGSGVAFRWPATASTNEGATEEENCLLGRKRHKPVSSIHVRASSKVRVPSPFWRILSARAASNCSDVKEKPHFQAGR